MKKIFISFMVLLAFVLSGCSFPSFKSARPETGVWYCEELKMKLFFGTRTDYINGYPLSMHGEYVDIDGSTVRFGIASEDGCSEFRLWYVGRPDFNHVFFHGACDYWDDDKMLVTEWLDEDGKEKGKSYLFIRQEEG